MSSKLPEGENNNSSIGDEIERLTKIKNNLRHLLRQFHELEPSDATKIDEEDEDEYVIVPAPNADLAINRLVIGEAAASCLCEKHDLSTEIGRILSADKEYVAKLLTKQNNLSRVLLIKHEEYKALEDECFDLKRNKIELENTKIKLLEEIEKIKSSSKEKPNDLSPMLESNLKDNIALAEIIRNVFQKLIHGSGINWAEDENMLKLVLDLGRTPHI